MLIGAPYQDTGGAVYLIYGKSGGFTDINLADLTNPATNDGTMGFAIPGTIAGGHLGQTVTSAGDINGDGYDDITIAAPSANTVYTIFGAAGGDDIVTLLGIDHLSEGSVV